MGYENPPETIVGSAKNLHIEDLVFLKKENVPWEKQQASSDDYDLQPDNESQA